MAEILFDCPRCKAKQVTFNFLSEVQISIDSNSSYFFEAFCCCRICRKSSVLLLRGKCYAVDKILLQYGSLSKYPEGLNSIFEVQRYLSLADMAVDAPPDYVPLTIEKAFNEGAKCLSVGCYNAACAMFRLCLDLATKELIPVDDAVGLNAKIRKSLGLRLGWLFDNGQLPVALRDLSSCIKEDGNDGAHDGSLEKLDAEDVKDFTYILLERLYTEPARVKVASDRRLSRRAMQ